MGNTKVICTVSGPTEPKGAGGTRAGGDNAEVRVDISIAGFSGVDRKRRGRNDKYVFRISWRLGLRSSVSGWSG
jgi:exosome complex component RRP41